MCELLIFVRALSVNLDFRVKKSGCNIGRLNFSNETCEDVHSAVRLERGHHPGMMQEAQHHDQGMGSSRRFISEAGDKPIATAYLQDFRGAREGRKGYSLGGIWWV